MVITITANVSPNNINRLGFVVETLCVSCEVRAEFVCYLEEIQSLKVVKSGGCQSRQKVKYGHESCGTRNQESMCCRGPAAISQSVSELVFKGLLQVQQCTY
jgi:hypothetical protein